jgi:hypothetical protein
MVIEANDGPANTRYNLLSKVKLGKKDAALARLAAFNRGDLIPDVEA